MTNISVAERQNWIGASEVAGLLGVSPFTSRFQLWHEKRGSVPRANLDGEERIEAGRFLEPAIAAWASYKWNWPVFKVTDYLVHPTVPRMGASLDFETADGFPVEVKNVDYSAFREKWEAEGDELTDAPIHYLVQVQAQLACRPGRDHGWLVACVGGNSLYRMRVDRHPGLIARIEEAVREFWLSVEENREPRPDFEADLETLSLLYARATGGTVDLSTSNRAPEVFGAYVQAHAREKAAGEEKAAALAEIKSLVGGAAVVIPPHGFRLTISDIAEVITKPSVRKAHRRFLIREAS